MEQNMEGLSLDSFSLPVTSVGLAKSQSGEEEPWMIEGLASTPTQDQQGEIVLVKGLDLSYLEQGKGTFNWNHFGDKDPSSVVGLITRHNRTLDGELYVKGKLLKALPKAKACYDLMKALDSEGEVRRMGMSIEGKVLHKQNRVIYKAWVKAVALTMDPVNPDTYVKFAKSFAGAEYVPQGESALVDLDPSVLERAIAIAKSEASSGSVAEGSVLVPESLERDVHNLGYAGGKKRKQPREKMSKGYSYDEAFRYIKSLVPHASDEFVSGLVQFAFSQQEHTR
jgi:hypothetical protein